MEELFVVICVVSGDMMGDACGELEATEDALIADAGMEAVEEMDGRKYVWTWLGFARLVVEDCGERDCEIIVVVVGSIEVVVAVTSKEEGLEVADMVTGFTLQAIE